MKKSSPVLSPSPLDTSYTHFREMSLRLSPAHLLAPTLMDRHTHLSSPHRYTPVTPAARPLNAEATSLVKLLIAGTRKSVKIKSSTDLPFFVKNVGAGYSDSEKDGPKYRTPFKSLAKP